MERRLPRRFSYSLSFCFGNSFPSLFTMRPPRDQAPPSGITALRARRYNRWLSIFGEWIPFVSWVKSLCGSYSPSGSPEWNILRWIAVAWVIFQGGVKISVESLDLTECIHLTFSSRFANLPRPSWCCGLRNILRRDQGSLALARSHASPWANTPSLVVYKAPIVKRPISASVAITVSCNQANLSRVAAVRTHTSFLLAGYFCLGRNSPKTPALRGNSVPPLHIDTNRGDAHFM
jgi:hypothetical protein